MNIPAPEVLTQRLSRRAVEIAQMIGPRKTGKGLSSLTALHQTGYIGIEIPDSAAYMFDLEKGVQEHAMVDLSNRVIPIRNTDGSISFRKVGANKVGTIPIITRLAKDGRIQTDKPRWIYPEKDGLGFLQKSMQMSINEWQRSTRTEEVINLLLKTDQKDMVAEIFYGRPMA
jgi:hypothetical protein